MIEATVAILREKLSTADQPVQKVDLLNELSQQLRLTDIEQAVSYAQQAIALAEDCGYDEGLAYGKVNISFYHYYIKADAVRAFQLAREAQAIFERIGNISGQGWALAVMGHMYIYMGDYDKGFTLLQRGDDMLRATGNLNGQTLTTYLLGSFYLDMKDYEKALQYHEEALDIATRLGDEGAQATSIGGLGNIYHALHQYDKALECHLRSYELATKIINPNTQARALNDIGMLYETLGDDAKAIDYLHQSLEMRQKINNYQGMITCYLNLGKVHLKFLDFARAIESLEKAIEKAALVGAKPKMMRAYQLMAQVYKTQEQPWQALEAYEKYMEIKATVAGEEVNTQLKNAQAVFAVEKAQQEAEIQKLKHVELREAYDKIETQTRSIIDSIKYAKRIQEAILDPVDIIEQQLGDAFILYLPRDIVSGDFYWYTEMTHPQEGDPCKIIVAADCTGHGVPGAFMTVMGNDFLNEIVNTHRELNPAQILYSLDQKIVHTLQKQVREGRMQDGMDISILRIDTEKRRLHFSAAKNPLYHVRMQADGQSEIYEIKGSKFPVGSSQFKTSKHFENHVIDIEPGDMFYIFSDGFQDQFGGENGHKYLKKRFREFLHRISPLPVAGQKQLLDREIHAWKGERHQTDDVLVIGLKF